MSHGAGLAASLFGIIFLPTPSASLLAVAAGRGEPASENFHSLGEGDP